MKCYTLHEKIERSARYGNYFKKPNKKTERINPKAQVIVIGPADMAKKESTSFITYPFINEVREALKKAAFETHSLLLGYLPSTWEEKGPFKH